MVTTVATVTAVTIVTTVTIVPTVSTVTTVTTTTQVGRQVPCDTLEVTFSQRYQDQPTNQPANNQTSRAANNKGDDIKQAHMDSISYMHLWSQNGGITYHKTENNKMLTNESGFIIWFS